MYKSVTKHGTFIDYEIYGTVLFMVLSQHTGSKYNSTHLIQYGRIDFKQFLTMGSEYRTCRAQN